MSQGDETAFRSLFDKYHHVLFRNVMRLLHTEQEAQDVVQEVFITLWEKRDGVDVERGISGWLFTLSYNRAVNHLKQKLRRDLLAQSISGQAGEPDDAALFETQHVLLEAAMKTLSPKRKKVFELCRLQGKTYEEAAHELGISRHTVNEYLKQAMVQVRKYIREHPPYANLLAIFAVELYFR